jgi:type II secretory pathway component GspD/PulD (secretin)
VGIGTLSHSAFQWTINMLKTRTDTSILSNPTVAVLNNQQAKIHIGDEYPIPNYSIDPSTGNTTISGYTSKNLGTVLQVTPHVNPSNEIVVDLKPEITTFSENVTYTTGTGNSVSLPRFTIQTAQTQVRIASSDTIAIGGLVKESRSKVESKVPVLGDLPIVGALFSNVRDYSGGSDPVKQDLLIFLTVSLLDQPAPEAGPTLAAAPAQAAPTP